MTANLRAITITQPCAWAIVKKGQRIEDRTWSTKCGGDLFILAEVGYGDEQELQEEFGLHVPPDLPRGAFVAICRLADVVTESDDGWFEGE